MCHLLEPRAQPKACRERGAFRVHPTGKITNMTPNTATAPALPNAPAEADLVRRAAAGEHAAFEMLMRRCNQQVFRMARGILKDDAEAEDAVQEAYVTAYRALKSFRGDSKLSTWLGRIVINESLGRLRRRKGQGVVVPFAEPDRDLPGEPELADERTPSPEDSTLRTELRALLEHEIDALPLAFRTVFVMREVEDMTVEETAQCLGIPEPTVRTRLFRAKALLRSALASEIELTTCDVFSFAGDRCDRIVAAVLARTDNLSTDEPHEEKK
jgi:RNA polymerase sigma-70 factor (ECF subfamily)